LVESLGLRKFQSAPHVHFRRMDLEVDVRAIDVASVARDSGETSPDFRPRLERWRRVAIIQPSMYPAKKIPKSSTSGTVYIACIFPALNLRPVATLLQPRKIGYDEVLAYVQTHIANR
jgi:hypothetical protein